MNATNKTGGGLSSEARRISEKIKASNSVVVASHIDADGITAASVASSALDRAEARRNTVPTVNANAL